MAEIKYHDNNGPKKYETDINGYYANNWDPCGHYADDEYIRVYFRIDCPAYRSGNNFMQFDNANEHNAFYNEMAETLIPLGWSFNEIKPGCYGTDGKKGKAHLYVHPDQVSGTVLKKDVKAIAEALAEQRTFSIRWVDLYETVFDYTDDEYRAYLETRKNDVTTYILSHSKTTRKNLFKRTGDIIMDAALSVRRKRVGLTDGCCICGDKVETDFISSIVNELVKTGYLVKFERDNDLYIRTINKTEQRKLKLCLEAS